MSVKASLLLSKLLLLHWHLIVPNMHETFFATLLHEIGPRVLAKGNTQLVRQNEFF